jgi:hypothetical protein
VVAPVGAAVRRSSAKQPEGGSRLNGGAPKDARPPPPPLPPPEVLLLADGCAPSAAVHAALFDLWSVPDTTRRFRRSCAGRPTGPWTPAETDSAAG